MKNNKHKSWQIWIDTGGPLTLTDVNLLLGRLDPRNFHIPVDRESAEQRLKNLFQK